MSHGFQDGRRDRFRRRLRTSLFPMAGVPGRVVRAAATAGAVVRRSCLSLRQERDDAAWRGTVRKGSFPDGFYVFLLHGIDRQYGGLTASVLARAGAFVDAGQPVTVAMFGTVP